LYSFGCYSRAVKRSIKGWFKSVQRYAVGLKSQDWRGVWKKQIIRKIRRWKKELRLERRIEKENHKNDTPLGEGVKTGEAYGKRKPQK